MSDGGYFIDYILYPVNTFIIMNMQERMNPQQSNLQIWNTTRNNLNIKDANFMVFLKYSTFQNKSSEQCIYTLFDSKQLLKLNKIMSILFDKYSKKQLFSEQLSGHWGLLSFLIQKRTGLFVNQIFLLITQNQLVKQMYPQEEWYQMDQTIKILLNSEWKKNQEFVAKISVLLNMPQKEGQTSLQVQSSFKILGFLNQQEEFTHLIKRLLRILQDYKVIQQKQKQNHLLSSILSQPIFPQQNYVISEPDSFIRYQFNMFSEQEVQKISKHGSLDQKRLFYESKFEEGQSTMSFSKNNNQSQTKSLSKRSIRSQLNKNTQQYERVLIKRQRKDIYIEGLKKRYKKVNEYFKKIQPIFRKKQAKLKLKKVFRKTYIDSTIQTNRKQKRVVQEYHNQKIGESDSSYQHQKDGKMIEQSQQITMKRNLYKKVPQQRKNKKQINQNYQNQKQPRLRTQNRNRQKQSISFMNNQPQDQESQNKYSELSDQQGRKNYLQDFQNSETKQFVFAVKHKQNRRDKQNRFGYLKQKKQQNYQKPRNLNRRQEQIYYQNIQDIQIKNCHLNQETLLQVVLDPIAYRDYLNSFHSQKEVKRQVFQLVKQFLDIKQSKSELKCIRKVLIAYSLSLNQQITDNYWKNYAQLYLVSIIKKFIFQHMSMLIAEQINVLFTSEENQNVQLLNKHLSFIRFIFQQFKVTFNIKAANQAILNLTKWIYGQSLQLFKTTSKYFKQSPEQVERTQNLTFIKNSTTFQNQLRISLKPIDQFTSILVSLLLLQSSIMDISTKNFSGDANLIYKQKNNVWVKQISEILRKNISEQTNRKIVFNMLKSTNKCFQIAIIRNKSNQQTFKLKCKIVCHFISYLKKVNQQHISSTNLQAKRIKDNMYNEVIKLLKNVIVEFIQAEKQRFNALSLMNIVTKQTQLKQFFDQTFSKIQNNNSDSTVSYKEIQINLAVAIQILKTFLTFELFIKNQNFLQKILLKYLILIKQYLLNNQNGNYQTSFLTGFWQLFIELYKLQTSANIWNSNDYFLKQNSEYQRINKSNIILWDHIEKYFLFIQKKLLKFSGIQISMSTEEQQKTKKYAKILKYFIQSIFQTRKISSNFQNNGIYNEAQVNKNVLILSIPHYFNLVKLLCKINFLNSCFKFSRILDQKQQLYQNELMTQNLSSYNNFCEKRMSSLNCLLQVKQQKTLNQNRKNMSQDDFQGQKFQIDLKRNKQRYKIIQVFLNVINENNSLNTYQIKLGNYQNNLQHIKVKSKIQGIVHSLIYVSKFYSTPKSKQYKNDVLTELKKYQHFSLINKFNYNFSNQQIAKAQQYFTGITYFISKYLAMSSSSSSNPDQKKKAQKIIRNNIFSDKTLNIIGSFILIQIILNKPQNVSQLGNMFIRIYLISLQQRQSLNSLGNVNHILYKVFSETKPKTLRNYQQISNNLLKLSRSQSKQMNKNLSQFSKTSMDIFQFLLIVLKQNINICRDKKDKSDLIKNLLKCFNTILLWPQLVPNTISKYLNEIQPGSQKQILKYFKLNYQGIKLIIQTRNIVQKINHNIFQIKDLPKVIVQSIIKQIFQRKYSNRQNQSQRSLFQTLQDDPTVNLFDQFIQIFGCLERYYKQAFKYEIKQEQSNVLTLIQNFANELCHQFLKPLISQKFVIDRQHIFQRITEKQKNENANFQCRIVFTFLTTIKQSDLLRKQQQATFAEIVGIIQKIIENQIKRRNGIQNSASSYTIESIIKKYLIGRNSDFYVLKALVNQGIQKIKGLRQQESKIKIVEIQAILQKIIETGKQALQSKKNWNFIGMINQDLLEWFINKFNQLKQARLSQNKNSNKRFNEMQMEL